MLTCELLLVHMQVTPSRALPSALLADQAMLEQRAVFFWSLSWNLPPPIYSSRTDGERGSLVVIPGSLGWSAKLLTGEGRDAGELLGCRGEEVISWHAFETSPTMTPGATSNLGVEYGLGVDLCPHPRHPALLNQWVGGG